MRLGWCRSFHSATNCSSDQLFAGDGLASQLPFDRKGHIVFSRRNRRGLSAWTNERRPILTSDSSPFASIPAADARP
jgi:hypothetical protein